MRHWPPERDHAGGNYGAEVHHQALPTLVEVERDPDVRRLMPQPQVMKKPARKVMKKPAAKVVKKPAKKTNKTKAKPAKKVVKKPAAAKNRVLEVVTKPDKHVRKKPASSRVR